MRLYCAFTLLLIGGFCTLAVTPPVNAIDQTDQTELDALTPAEGMEGNLDQPELAEPVSASVPPPIPPPIPIGEKPTESEKWEDNGLWYLLKSWLGANGEKGDSSTKTNGNQTENPEIMPVDPNAPVLVQKRSALFYDDYWVETYPDSDYWDDGDSVAEDSGEPVNVKKRETAECDSSSEEDDSEEDDSEEDDSEEDDSDEDDSDEGTGDYSADSQY